MPAASVLFGGSYGENLVKKVKKEVLRFLAAGFSAVGTDCLVYFLLLKFLEPSIAKVISFVSGTVVAFLMNKFWTFEQKRRSLSEVGRFILLYGSTLFANVGVNKLVLLICPKYLLVAFLCATATSAVLNFIGQKFWVFK